MIIIVVGFFFFFFYIYSDKTKYCVLEFQAQITNDEPAVPVVSWADWAPQMSNNINNQLK